MDEINHGVVERVFSEPSIPPVIAITEVGYLNSASELDCGMAIEAASSRPILKIFNKNGGTVEEEDQSRKDLTKKYLVLRNKKTNKVSIYGTKVMYLKKPDYFKLKTYEENLLLPDRNIEFNSVFGTKRALRMSKSRTDDAVDVSSDILNNVSSSSDLKLISQSSELNEFSSYLPPGCDRFSSKVENVYPVSTLLSEYEIDLMTEFAKEVISMMPITKDCEDLSKFFKLNIQKVTHKNIQNICLLAFADGLIELLKKKPGDLNYRYNEIYPNCQFINNKIMDGFVEYSVDGGELSSRMKDKAVCHIVIILVLLNKNLVDLSSVSPFLPSSSQKRLILLMRVVGLTALKEDKTKFVLKIPLASLPPCQNKPRRGR